MKPIQAILSIVILCLFTSANATIRTVSNNYNSPGQYTSVSSAMAASSANDTIYISGSPFSYGDFTVSKALTLIGPGHQPAKQNPLAASMGIITMSASSIRLIGLTIASVNFNVITLSGCLIHRCKISDKILSSNASFFTTGLVVSGCIFTNTGTNIQASTSGGTTYSWTIKNNIFNGQIINLSSSNGTSYILNNIFIHATLNTNAFGSVNTCVVNNNIFWATEPKGLDGTSTMNSNISYSCADGTFAANVPGTGNLPSTDPKFAGYNTNSNFSYTQDFHLQPTSPGILSGNDGADRGVYGGNNNWFSMTGEPAIPEITGFTISSSTVNPGGSITVNVTSTRIQ